MAQQNCELVKANGEIEVGVVEREHVEDGLSDSYAKLQRTLEATVHAMALAVEMRDPYTAGHQRRVADLACAIAGELGLSSESMMVIKLAALVHDIGKISVPAEILNRPGTLNEWEFALIKSHPKTAFDILKTIEFPWPIAEIVLQHHEAVDGSGYPRGLSGDDVLAEARILAVADVADAMVSHRPYRPALDLDTTIKEISRHSGGRYEPRVVDACLKVLTENRVEIGQRFESTDRGENLALMA